MTGRVLPFLLALVICLGAFVALDAAIMSMQGLSLIFHQ